jgi:hypothetical protein
MWHLINNLLYDNKIKNKKDNNFYKDLINMENFIGYIIESSIEKNLNSINYNFDDISDTENYNIINNLERMLKKYLYENQKLLNFSHGVLSKFDKNINYISQKSIDSNLIKCWIDEAIIYFIDEYENKYINFELLKKILEKFRLSNIIFENISSYDNQLINNYLYTIDLEKEIHKNINNFMNIIKKIFYVLINKDEFRKSSFYNLIMIKMIDKILNNINYELINMKFNKNIIIDIGKLSYENSINKFNENLEIL